MAYALSDVELAKAIEQLLGPGVCSVFDDPDVTELYVNADGLLRTMRYSRGRSVEGGISLKPKQIEQFLNVLASSTGTTLGSGRPALQAELPLHRFRGARIQGEIPPLVAAPAFNLRKRPARIITLDEYVTAGVLSVIDREIMRLAVREHWNILVAGSTGSGKTTLANALIHEMHEQATAAGRVERFVILEDTVELLYEAPDVLALRTPEGWNLGQLVKLMLRATPERPIVGEVRDGAAMHLLHALRTHSGGLCTVHATSPRRALHAMDWLAREVARSSQVELVADVIDLVVMITNTPQGRRVSDLVRVDGLDERGQFRISPIAS
ncbi:MAG TPA: ATPase, T2SS/T4P/T4SS family [Longimicrobium sp.]|nr:ATPase, T2SS/T4P/T4SS family [Longimicrobium sp.]